MTPEGRRTLIEVSCTTIIVACLVALAIPKIIDLRRRDDAQRMLADIEIVREAVYRFYSDSAAFPPEAPGGQFSDQLNSYLPGTFTRTRPYGVLEYRNWPMADSLQRPDSAATDKPKASNVVAIAIIPRDPRIAAAAAAMAYAMPQFVMGNRYFFVLFGS